MAQVQHHQPRPVRPAERLDRERQAALRRGLAERGGQAAQLARAVGDERDRSRLGRHDALAERGAGGTENDAHEQGGTAGGSRTHGNSLSGGER
jgi:hypothetical protein